MSNCGGRRFLFPGALLFRWGRPVALRQTAHDHTGNELLFAVIVEFDHDTLFAAGQDRSQTELLMLDLGALRESIRCHKFANASLLGRIADWREDWRRLV